MYGEVIIDIEKLQAQILENRVAQISSGSEYRSGPVRDLKVISESSMSI